MGYTYACIRIPEVFSESRSTATRKTEITKGVQIYEERLGLRIRRLPGNVKFFLDTQTIFCKCPDGPLSTSGLPMAGALRLQSPPLFAAIW